MGEGKGKKDEGQQKKSSEEGNGITVVLKTEMHCEGCATKILKCVKTIEGVGKAKAEWEANKLTVKGEVDPSELREELQERLGKKVELISPQPPKKSDKDGGGDSKKKDEGGKKKDDGKSGKDDKKSDDKKPKEKKEAPVTTAVLKLRLHCMGCIVKIHKLASKTEGVKSISIDKEKELVTVTGTMDVKALAESLEEKMKRSVAIVPAKKDKDSNGGGDGSKDAGGGGGGKKNKKSDGDDEAGGGGGMFEGNRMEYVGVPPPSYGPMFGQAQGQGLGPGYGHPSYPYANPYTYGNSLHAPQIFSDENPNACSVM